eukprot:9027271-Prorocentrum_lima.AAC.1
MNIERWKKGRDADDPADLVHGDWQDQPPCLNHLQDSSNDVLLCKDKRKGGEEGAREGFGGEENRCGQK